ncbi:transcription termination factor NusA [Companilactobacillus bobalius]|uniref:Transcription termination/antitermination protein NusA n=2 Tax=Companilactobacillus bobalius TaxID=2801451 RepID=A0A202F491_9LACO|nr:transcription termination factor NusA [Companilactobacillus bobalius]KAE9560066.1 transcription elongation factor NusA [Companilactobacillus bobalius]KRK84961.1 transcription elongation factor NusA [Companilactobacillus bobalius DSM 19674]OVE95306.1 Transcription termination/antitermination protein NusA [Companilactobacillus bobalius]GEO58638.1 transcription termination/antitermination protein NusA [Companilactobacillus paralimentarius]
MSKEMVEALDALESEKGIKKEYVIESLEAALVAAYKRNYNQAQNVNVEFDTKKGNIHVYAVKEVVEDVVDDRLEVSLEDAQKKSRGYEVGDHVQEEVTPKDFGRIAAQTAKQVIMQRVREAERDIIYNEYSQYEHEIIQGTVERSDNRYVYINFGKIEAVMSKNDQMPGETYNSRDRIRVYVTKVENATKGPQVFVSRTDPGLVKRLFEQQVPEIYDGTVEIVSIAREAGDRTKIAVKSDNPDVDPVGTCVGPKGARVQAVVDELNGENIDVVPYVDDPVDFIANALNPAEVIAVQFDENDKKQCIVIVPDYHLSLAIGKKGQNARLAAKLTGYKIDIKPESQVEFVDDNDQDVDINDVESGKIDIEKTRENAANADDAQNPAANDSEDVDDEDDSTDSEE